MRKPEPYDETIDYKDLLTRYIKHIYKEWISVPRNAEKYHPMVGRDIQFNFFQEVQRDGYVNFCFTGDVSGHAVVMERGENPNMVFYKLFNNVLSSGIRIYTDTGHAIDEKWAYSFYEGTISDLMIQLGLEHHPNQKRNQSTTKYIHYLKRALPDILISDNVDESGRGYTLGLEIECNCFDAMLKSMMVMHDHPFAIQDNIVTNQNLFGFTREFRRLMDESEQFENEEYTLRVIHDDHVTQFSKRVLPQRRKDDCGA
jgi:hypothetical protein